MFTNTRWAAVIAGLGLAFTLSACVTPPPSPTVTATPAPSQTATSSPTTTSTSTPPPGATRTPTPTEATATDQPPFLQSGVVFGGIRSFAIDVVDQKISAGAITVAEVDAPVAAWVAVQQDSNGQPGAVIGQTLVKKGASKNVSVKIDVTKITGTLWVVIHVDEGKQGVFEFPGPDVPALDAKNHPIQKLFKILNS